MFYFLGNAIFAGGEAPAGCSKLTKSLDFITFVLQIAPNQADLEFIKANSHDDYQHLDPYKLTLPWICGGDDSQIIIRWVLCGALHGPLDTRMEATPPNASTIFNALE